ncbi:hypothetical protein ACFQ4D_16305 [Oceanobacillus profundus]
MVNAKISNLLPAVHEGSRRNQQRNRLIKLNPLLSDEHFVILCDMMMLVQRFVSLSGRFV